MNSSKILFGASYSVCTHCDINSCERKKVVIHDVAHCDLILCYVYAMKVISVKWHQVSHTTDSVLLSWLHCSSPSSASRVPIRPGKSHYICKLIGWLFIILTLKDPGVGFCPLVRRSPAISQPIRQPDPPIWGLSLGHHWRSISSLCKL